MSLTSFSFSPSQRETSLCLPFASRRRSVGAPLGLARAGPGASVSVSSSATAPSVSHCLALGWGPVLSVSLSLPMSPSLYQARPIESFILISNLHCPLGKGRGPAQIRPLSSAVSSNGAQRELVASCNQPTLEGPKLDQQSRAAPFKSQSPLPVSISISWGWGWPHLSGIRFAGPLGQDPLGSPRLVNEPVPIMSLAVYACSRLPSLRQSKRVRFGSMFGGAQVQASANSTTLSRQQDK